MADEAQQPESTEPTKVKRRLRSAPETMRERSEKLQNQQANTDNTPSVTRSFWRGFTLPVRLLGRLLSKIGGFLGKFKVFRAIGYVLVPPYIRNSYKELKLVEWPNFVLAWRLTYAVLIFSIIFGVVVAILDFGLDKVFKEIFAK